MHKLRRLGGTAAAATLTVTFTATLPVDASAQTPPSSPLEEIIVTATRMEKSLDRVPAAISVVGEDEIQLARQQLALDESLSRVPGVFMQNRYNFAQDLRVSIRGFGARAQFGIRGIKILVDGIPETLPDGQGAVDSVDLGATSQIEVLRGPSSSLYGNASGGVINITSQGAPQEPFSEVRLMTGKYDYQKLQFKAGGEGDRLGYLVSVSDAELDGYRTQSRYENTQVTGRLNFDLGEDREFMTVVSFTDQPVSDDPGGVNLAEIAADRRAARDANVDYDAGESLEQTRIGFGYNMPLGEGQLAVRNYYAWRDFENLLPFTDGGNVVIDRSFSGGLVTYTREGMLGGKPNQFVVGVDFDDQDDDRFRYDNAFGVRGPLVFDQNENVSSYGIFAQNDVSLSETVELSFGVRFDEVKFDVTDQFLADGNDSGSRSLDDVSPMVGILFDLSDSLSVYGTYSTAFETPTTTEFNQPDGSGGFNPNVDPQFAENLEVGLRGRFSDRSRYEVALFDISVDDELIPIEIPTSPGRDYYVNAVESSRRGLELSLVAEPTDRLSTTLSYTYSDFEFDEFDAFAGNTIPGTTEDVLFGEVVYEHPRGWFGAFDLVHIGDQFANNANTVVNEAYTVANLRFGWEHDMGSMSISPFVGINNLFDEIYNGNVRINAFGGRFFEPAPERNAYAGVTIRFRHD
jgi:iron complex outermembrane receptor protein